MLNYVYISQLSGDDACVKQESIVMDKMSFTFSKRDFKNGGYYCHCEDIQGLPYSQVV